MKHNLIYLFYLEFIYYHIQISFYSHYLYFFISLPQLWNSKNTIFNKKLKSYLLLKIYIADKIVF